MSSPKRKTAFIVLEGIDGAGKTVVAKKLVEMLRSEGHDALYTYEPFTEDITALLNKVGKEFGAIFETLLMAADRYYHLEKVIKPALRKGMVVVSDRYYYSSIAYQGARGANIEWVRLVNDFVIEPDVAIYLDVDPSIGLARKRNSTTRVLYLEEDIRVSEAVRRIYMDLVNEGLLVRINAEEKFETVVKESARIVCEKTGLLCSYTVSG